MPRSGPISLALPAFEGTTRKLILLNVGAFFGLLILRWLAPQLEAVLHSHLGDAERGSTWRRIAAGGVQVVVGARSAIFAPARKLGLIVIDEEHETSFKQESTPRYHARDVGVMRARLENIPILLGSATSSARRPPVRPRRKPRKLPSPDNCRPPLRRARWL